MLKLYFQSSALHEPSEIFFFVCLSIKFLIIISFEKVNTSFSESFDEKYTFL